MPTTRRQFVGFSAAAVAAGGLGPGWLAPRRVLAADLGPLVPDPDGILDLPQGFTYRILEQVGDEMSDGYRVPGFPDGMACFPGPGGTLILMRNHELDFGDGPTAWRGDNAPDEAYDPGAPGGVTRVVLDAETRQRVSSNLVLSGTVYNCAGGPTPWGWLSCEESTDGIHGYVFLCRTDAESVQMPDRKPGFGRFVHEAAAVDPSTSITYLTEDRSDSCLYRFVPDDPSDPFTGTLQALKVVGENRFDTAEDNAVGDRWDVEWVDIDDPDAADESTREQGQSQGAARFTRGEGIWFFEDRIYVCSTTGGPAESGQIFMLTTDDTLELVAQSEDTEVLDMPDNITVAPWGDVFMAEDGSGTDFIRMLDREGAIADFARNASSNGEFAGVCFSPDGNALFVNMQSDGLTLVIEGPFWQQVAGTEPPDEMPGDGEMPGGGETPGDGETPGGEPSDGPMPGGESPGSGGDGPPAAGGDGSTGMGGTPSSPDDAEAPTEVSGSTGGCSASGGGSSSGVAESVAVALYALTRRRRKGGDPGDEHRED